jgi:hypothetical protein
LRLNRLDQTVARPARSQPQIVVGLPRRAKGAEMRRWAENPDGDCSVIGCGARKCTRNTPANRPRRPRARPTLRNACCGRNRWKVSADPRNLAYISAMPQRRLRLARGHVQTLRNPRQPSARHHPPPPRYAHLETGKRVPVPILRDAALPGSGPHDQADEGAEDRALCLDASGG